MDFLQLGQVSVTDTVCNAFNIMSLTQSFETGNCLVESMTQHTPDLNKLLTFKTIFFYFTLEFESLCAYRFPIFLVGKIQQTVYATRLFLLITLFVWRGYPLIKNRAEITGWHKQSNEKKLNHRASGSPAVSTLKKKKRVSSTSKHWPSRPVSDHTHPTYIASKCAERTLLWIATLIFIICNVSRPLAAKNITLSET